MKIWHQNVLDFAVSPFSKITGHFFSYTSISFWRRIRRISSKSFKLLWEIRFRCSIRFAKKKKNFFSPFHSFSLSASSNLLCSTPTVDLRFGKKKFTKVILYLRSTVLPGVIRENNGKSRDVMHLTSSLPPSPSPTPHL